MNNWHNQHMPCKAMRLARSAWSMLCSRFESFLSIGIGDGQDQVKRRARLLVRYGLAITLLANIIVFYGLAQEMTPWRYLANILVCTGMYCLAFALFAAGKNKIGNSIFAATLFIGTFDLVIAGGQQTVAYMLYIPIAMSSAIFLPGRRLWQSLYCSLALILFVLCDYFIKYGPVGWEGLLLLDRAYVANMLVVFLGSYAVVALVENTALDLQLRLDAQLLKEKDILEHALPSHVVEEIRQNGSYMARSIGDCAVVFVDIVGFTDLSEHIKPDHLVALLNSFYNRLDELAMTFGLIKIKNSGDAFIAICESSTHPCDFVCRAADFALACQQFTSTSISNLKSSLQIRVGISAGEVNAGILGRDRLAYDVWGATVNRASRMESTAEAGKIHLSGECYPLLDPCFDVLPRDQLIDIKSYSGLSTWWLVGKH